MNLALSAQSNANLMESVLIKGDLSKLTPQERSNYYLKVCESMGLNPLTKPFEYIILNGKLTLYALRTCTDQLRTIHNVSVEEITKTERDGVFIVTVKVRNGKGRTDAATGAVTIANLKGDAFANAVMKAETKAKRRATLSICGLGFLDELEIETIPPNARTVPVPETVERHNAITGEITDDDSEPLVSIPQMEKIQELLMQVPGDFARNLKTFCTFYRCGDGIEKLKAADFERAKAALEKKIP